MLSGSSYKKSSTSACVFVLVLFSLTAVAAWDPNKSFPIPPVGLLKLDGCCAGTFSKKLLLLKFKRGGGAVILFC